MPLCPEMKAKRVEAGWLPERGCLFFTDEASVPPSRNPTNERILIYRNKKNNRMNNRISKLLAICVIPALFLPIAMNAQSRQDAVGVGVRVPTEDLHVKGRVRA